MKSPTETRAFPEDEIALRELYDKLEETWLLLQADPEAGERAELEREEKAIIGQIEAIERKKNAPKKTTVNYQTDDVREDIAAVTAGPNGPRTEKDSPVHIDPEEATAQLWNKIFAADSERAIAHVLIQEDPAVLLRWAKELENDVKKEVSFDNLMPQTARDLEMWIKALDIADGLRRHMRAQGMLDKHEAADAKGLLRQVALTLQNLLLNYHTEDDKEGKRLGTRNKPHVKTDGGNYKISPVGRDAANATWGTLPDAL
jgi:hypothetical protein